MKKNLLLLIVITIISFQVYGQKGVELGKKGLEVMNEKDYDKALTYFEKALKINPNQLNSLYYSGFAYEKKKSYKKAIEFYSKCAELKEFPEVFTRRGTCYFLIKEDSLAIIDLTKSLELKPENSEAIMQRAGAYRRTGQYEKLLDDLNSHLQKVPNDFYTKANKATALTMLERYEEANELFINLTKEKPNEYRLYNGVADTYMKMGKLEEALNSIEKALEINDKYANGYITKAEILIKMDKKEEACKAFSKAEKNGFDMEEDAAKKLAIKCNE